MHSARFMLHSVNGASIPLNQLADIRFETSPVTIKHYDKDRYTVTTAFVQSGYNTGKLTESILKQLDTMHFPANSHYVAAGEVEASKESFGGLEHYCAHHHLRYSWHPHPGV